MRIKKTYQSAVRDGKVLNSRSDSQNDTYSCDYVNKIIKSKTSNINNQMTTMPVNSDFVCPSDGIIKIGGYGDAPVRLVINGIDIASFICNLTFGNSNTFFSWRVNSGDVVYIYCVNEDEVNTREFIPQ